MVDRMYHELPVAAYTSQEWFDREQDRIFSRVWHYAGFAEEVSKPGQYLPVQAGKSNILIVMGRDHRLRAFHNICRHRGAQLLRTTGKVQQAITCPYHDWTYDLEGCLLTVPDAETEYPSGIDKSGLGLKPASVGIWRGMLFVHPEPPDQAPALEEWFGAVDSQIGSAQPTEMTEIPFMRKSYEVKANWKVLVENFVDVYHLAHLHSATLDMFDHAKAEYGWHGPHFLIQEPMSAMRGGRRSSGEPGDSSSLAGSSPCFFPGIAFVVSDYFWSTFIMTPLAPDISHVETRTKISPKSAWKFLREERMSPLALLGGRKAKVSRAEAAGRNDPLASGDVILEDIYACEQQQKSFASPFFEVGPPARGESPVIEHQRVVLDYLR
ncbi:aromatic ring-hydroxylating oxygenase subunit alpha [Nocardia sp. 004]|uniref:aromatic ring-hydroxylating oxygenase subunit alpha n=1 Tax=Nocardia sp. 004 TaxID=3385978 RepID=UPI0039A22DB3